MNIELIATKELTRERMPATPQDWGGAFAVFALSCDGYKVLGDDLASFCNSVKALYEKHRKVLEAFGVDGLRMLLFYEQRRAHWYNDSVIDDYTKAIAAQLRRRLPKAP